MLWGRQLPVRTFPETIFIGPNNVGKSIMIGAYNWVRNFILRGGIEFDTTSYRWESLANIAHKHDPFRGIEMGISLANSYSGDFSVEWRHGDGQFSFKGSRDKIVSEEVGKGWYFAPSRNEVQPRIQVGYSPQHTAWGQPLDPFGSNVVTYLLERFTSRDPKWDVAEEWLKRIDPKLSILKSPLRGNQGSIELEQQGGVDINIAFQGTGIQKALTVIAGLVFSPEGSTIIVEEPEVHLHPRSQEVLVDLFNLAVNEWGKQVIFTTHSWDMLLPFISDLGPGPRGKSLHHLADPNKVRLVTFAQAGEKVEIKDYDLKGKIFANVKEDFKRLWG